MARSWQEGAPYGRLSLAEGQPDDHERSETIDITKVNSWGDVTPGNLQRWVKCDSENTCRLVLKALDQRDSYREQIDQKDSQIEKLITEKQELKQDVLKLTRRLNNPESEQPREGIPKSNASDTTKKRSAKFPDSSILNDGIKLTFWVWNDQMKSKLRINDDWFNRPDSEEAEHAKVSYIKTRVDGKAAEHLYPWLKAQSGRNVYVEKVIQCLKNVFEDPDRRLKAWEQLKKLRMPYLEDFNTFQSEFLRLSNSAKMSADQWKEEIHDKLYDSLRVQMEIYVADEDMSFDVYCKKAQQFTRGLIKADERTRERKDQWELQRKQSALKFERKTMITTTAVAREAPRPVLADITCYACNKKRHLARNCSEKSKEIETKVIESDCSGSDSENRLL